ncbi:PP2C family protein-serine/threonine phosphatase [Castellaniella sp. WN]
MLTERAIRTWLRDAIGGFLIVLISVSPATGILLWRLQNTVMAATQDQSRDLALSVGKALGRQFVRAGQLGIPLDAIPSIDRSLNDTLARVPRLTRIALYGNADELLGSAQRPGAGVPIPVRMELQVGVRRIGMLEVVAAPSALGDAHAPLLADMLPLIFSLASLGGVCTAFYGAYLRRHRRRLLALLLEAPEDLAPPILGLRPEPRDVLGQAWYGLQEMVARTDRRRASLAYQVESLLAVDFDGRVRARLAALEIPLSGQVPGIRIVPPDRSWRLSLWLRLTFVIALGFALLIGALSGLHALREHLLRQQAADLVQEDQNAFWDQFLSSQTLSIADDLRALSPHLDGPDGVTESMRAWATSLDYLVLVDPNHQAHPLKGADTDAAPLDAGTLDEVLAGRPARGLRNLGDNSTLLIAAQNIPMSGGTWALVGGRALENALLQIDPDGNDEEYSFHFLNPKGHLVASTGRAVWSRLDLTPSMRHEPFQVVDDEDRILLLTATPVSSVSGGAGGLFLSVKDVTTLMKPSRTLGWLALLLAVGLAILGVALIQRIIWRGFRPLQDALRTLDELSGPRNEADERPGGHQDEIERLGRSIAVFRHKTLQLARDHAQQARIRRRQEEVIAGELRTLSESTDDAGRREVRELIDLRPRGEDYEGLRRLAEVMGGLRHRLVAQHRQLSDMVVKLRDALVTKTKLAGLQQELRIASAVQLSILPRAMPDDPRMELGCRIFPARDVGGDFYDFYMLDEHHLGFVIADVSGKGIPAALFMAVSRTLLKSIACFVRRPADCIQRLNALLAAENEQMLFVTLFYATLDLRNGRLDYVNAGHHAPWLMSAGGGLSSLPPTRGVAAGIEEEIVYEQQTLYLRPGDMLYLYTDGITEAFDPDGRIFGEDRLAGLLRARPADVAPDALIDAVIADVRAFENGTDPTDDVTSLCLRYRGRAGG